MIEYEQRFELSEEDFNKISSFPISWSEPYAVTDIILGLSGATSMQTHGWIIRVRKNGTEKTIEYKAPMNSEGTRWEELSIGISDFSAAIKLLKKIGLIPALVLDRVRQHAQWDGILVSLDDFRFLGKFLEIEIQGENETARQQLLAVLTEMGLQGRKESKPYGTLMLEKMDNDEGLRKEINEFMDIISNEIKDV